MARSPAVWIVVNDIGIPVAAFTVKHELCTWLWKFENPQSIDHLHGWKVTDGVRHWFSRDDRSGPWPLDLNELRETGREQAEAEAAARAQLRDWKG
jgi:hypothetical protein